VDLLLGILWYVALLFSLTFHEAAHAFAARRGGDPTAYHGGQVSLDPRPHIRREPFGTVFVPLFSFAVSGWMIGWASTPFDPRWADAHPRRAAWMALAGPIANLLLVVAAGTLIRIGLFTGAFYAPEVIRFGELVGTDWGGVWATCGSLLSILFTLNLLLCVFNLLPVPPLDGAGAIGLLVGDDLARRLRQALYRPGVAIFGILIAWYLIGEIFSPIHQLAIRFLYPEFGYG
jgi:Zn-dependent protease